VREDQARRYYVGGTVQGVGYRYFTRGEALRIGVTGYVRNLRDGRVEVYAVGSTAKLEALRAELERGPRGASVSSVNQEEAVLDPRFTVDFSIEFDD
jgi:acylphosphatase